MIIEVLNDGLTKEDCTNARTSVACRGIIKKDDNFLTVHVKKFDITTFPGGGLEDNETLEECAKREVLEETGIECNVLRKTVEVREYFKDVIWVTHYFLCEYVEDTKKVSLTEEEIDIMMDVRWLSAFDLLDIFENNMTLHEHGPNIHNREFLGFINSM